MDATSATLRHARKRPSPDMYQTSIRHFLDLLRLGIEPGQSALTATDATHLVDLARQQLVASWYWHRLRRVGLAGQLAAPRQQELRGVGLAIATQGLCIESGISGVMQTLSEARISSVLLKGAAYSALTVRYPYIAQRQTGDVADSIASTRRPAFITTTITFQRSSHRLASRSKSTWRPPCFCLQAILGGYSVFQQKLWRGVARMCACLRRPYYSGTRWCTAWAMELMAAECAICSRAPR